MLKHLPVLILVLLLVTAAHAQTKADSAAHVIADTSAKQLPVDKAIIKSLRDSIARLQTVDTAKVQPVVDPVTKHIATDTIKQIDTDNALVRPSADILVKPLAVDMPIKHPVDTLVKTMPVDSGVLHNPVKNITKQSSADTLSSHSPATDSVVKQTAADTAGSHNPMTDNAVKQSSKDSVAAIVAPVKVVKKPTVKSNIVNPPPAIVIKRSPVKSLNDGRYNAYLKGDDVDSMAFVGEINHYPLPDKALKYKVQIGLNPGQVTKLKELSAALRRKKLEMGDNIIRNEKMLDSLFHSKQIVDGTLIFYTNRSGLYYGELKGVILLACYETERILSNEQIRELEALEKGN